MGDDGARRVRGSGSVMRIVRTGARLTDLAVMELEGILDACLQRKPRVAVAVSGG